MPRKYGQSSLCGVIFRGALVTEFDEKVCRAPRYFNAFCLQGKPALLLVSPPPPRNIEIYGGIVRQTEETFAGGARLSIRRNWMINKITGATLTRGIGKRIRSISRDNALPFDETSLSRGTIFFFFPSLRFSLPLPRISIEASSPPATRYLLYTLRIPPIDSGDALVSDELR